LAYQFRYNYGGEQYKVEKDYKIGSDLLLSFSYNNISLWSKLKIYDYYLGRGYYSDKQDLKYTLPGSFYIASQFGFSYSKYFSGSNLLKVYLSSKIMSFRKSINHWYEQSSIDRKELGILYEGERYVCNIEMLSEPVVPAQYTNDIVRRRWYSVLVGYKTKFLIIKPGISYIEEKILALDYQSLNSKDKYSNWVMNLALNVKF